MRRLTLAVVAVFLQVLPGPMPGGPWRPAPEYVALFAPAGPHREAYTAFVSTRHLSEILGDTAESPLLLRPPGAWQPQPQGPADAFGQAGGYDRWKVARLYGSRRAAVARGPVALPDGERQAWTLVSPYPDPALQRLEPGTLLIVLSLGK